MIPSKDLQCRVQKLNVYSSRFANISLCLCDSLSCMHLHVRLRLKIAPAGWHVMVGRQVAGKTDDPGQTARAIVGLNLTFKGNFTPASCQTYHSISTASPQHSHLARVIVRFKSKILMLLSFTRNAAKLTGRREAG